MTFNPEMLTLARQARERTQAELAASCSITQGHLSKIEHGLLTPNDEIIARFAGELAFPISFFHQDGANYPPPMRYHRKRKAMSQKVVDRVHAEINIKAMQVARLLAAAEIDADLELRHLDVEEYEGAIEDIARAIRSAWRLPRGPIRNMVRLLERAGIVIVSMRFGVREVDAVTQVIPNAPPMIFINQDAPTDRLRFTLAHELGHLVMHKFPHPEMEDQANRFAAEFLMPAEEILPQLSRVSLPVLAALKGVWLVSMAALLEQAKRLGCITQRQYIRLRAEFSRLGYIQREPAELDPPREDPTVVRNLVQFHFKNLKYGLDELAAILCDFPERVRAFYVQTSSHGLQLVG